MDYNIFLLHSADLESTGQGKGAGILRGKMAWPVCNLNLTVRQCVKDKQERGPSEEKQLENDYDGPGNK